MQLIALIPFRRNPEVMPSDGARARCKAVKATISNGKPTSEGSQFFHSEDRNMHFSEGQKVKQRLAGCHFVSIFKTLPSTSQDGHKSCRTSTRNEALYFCHSYVSNHVSLYIITSTFQILSLSIIQIPHDFQCSKISELTPRNLRFRPVSESILSKS